MCLPVILQWNSGFYFESRLVVRQSVLLLASMGIFLFSEAFLSREATARGTPRERRAHAVRMKVISSSSFHAPPFSSVSTPPILSLSLSLSFFLLSIYTNNCSTDFGIVVINRSPHKHEWNYAEFEKKRRANSAKERGEEKRRRREGEGREKKNNHPPLFFPRIHPFSAYGLAALKNVETNTRPGHKTRVLCPVQSGGETGNQVEREIISHYHDFSPFRLTFVRREFEFLALVPHPIHYAHYRRRAPGTPSKFNGGYFKKEELKRSRWPSCVYT